MNVYGNVRDLPLEEILANWRPGSQEWAWSEEFQGLLRDDKTRNILRSVIGHGFRRPLDAEEPIILGDDGRVWSGHHRILVGVLTQQLVLPIVLAEEAKLLVALNHKEWELPEIPSKIAKVKKARREPWDTFGPRLYTELQGHRHDTWRSTVLAFESDPSSTYNAYYYIAQHPMFWYFRRWGPKDPLVHERHLVDDEGWDRVLIHPAMVNPADHQINDDPQLNTQLEWWFEYGPTLWRDRAGDGISGHDWKRDGGAETYDAAIIKVAKSIHKHYGNDRRGVVTIWNDVELPSEDDDDESK